MDEEDANPGCCIHGSFFAGFLLIVGAAKRRAAASHDLLRHQRADRRRGQSRRIGRSRRALPNAG